MVTARRLGALALLFCCAFASGAPRAEETFTPPTPEQLAAQERVRPIVAAIWKDARNPTGGDEGHPRAFWEFTDRLIAIGPDVVPFLVSEIDLADPQTIHLAAYALGRLGGHDAEVALRKAARDADARANRFGFSCKRYALFALALLGQPDALELAQNGKIPMHGAEMVPEFSYFSHLAVLIGHDAGPVLAKQLETYATDPKATEKLEDTLLAIGYAGDPAVVPKLVPFLSHEKPRIRAVAADAIARLGDPSMCEQLMPLLATKDNGEKLVVGAALQRTKPEPCYKSMVGRLETESDIAIRANLYEAISAMGGESALPVLRPFLHSPNQFDQALVVDAIGRIGSKKGLNMLRSLLPEPNINAIAHALQAIANIGGEGAIDTLLATASDRRHFVASSAASVLTELGDKRIAPRRAAELLGIVKEPVGNLTLRSQIVELAEAVVALQYTEPIDDLKAALAVQTDLEIVDTLTSCIRRLELLAKHGDNAAAWTEELASTNKDVRQLAGARLAEIGSAAAVRALATQLSRSELPPDERAGILFAIGKARTSAAAELVERNLSDPAYDAWPVREARAAAAYAARRLGGDRMSKALRASALRRDGRDWATLVYLAILDKGAALDMLTSLRLKRLRYPDVRTGTEEAELEGILKDLGAGRTPTRYDVTPDTLFEL